LREEIAARLTTPSPPNPPLEGEGDSAIAWLVHEVGIGEAAARQLVDYYAAARIELGLLPTQSTLAMERFFDESGGMQLVIHSPLGSRLNRAWGLALRKRFCRSFNFELQAAATEDAIVLSLSTSHSFPLDEVARYLHSNSVSDVLTQALLDAPMFALRFRWNASAALALPRFAGGAKVSPQIQRMKSEDLLATVFPDQVACLENIVGERKIPDHPLVAQTLKDCLHDAMDLDGLLGLLKRLEAGEARIVACDLTAPSSLAVEVLGARPYAFLDGAPLEERRTQAVSARGSTDARSAEDLGRLDADAIEAVREEAWPAPRDADEMHEALLALGAISEDELVRNPIWRSWLDELAALRRTTRLLFSSRSGRRRKLWIAAELLPTWRAVHQEAVLEPDIEAPAEFAARTWTRDEAVPEILRVRLACSGVTDADGLSGVLAISRNDIDIALTMLEREGTAMRGRFSPGANDEEWCDRHLLARIHRRTVQRLRREIEPVAPRDFIRFLGDWQHLTPHARVRGPDALAAVLAQLEGYEAPAAAWESQLLPARVADYDIAWLDALCGAGRIAWTRLRASGGSAHASPVRASPIVLLPRSQMSTWSTVAARTASESAGLSSRAQAVADFLAQRGASFFNEITDGTRLLKVELEDALGELVGAGLVGADSFAGLRALLLPAAKRNRTRHRRLARHLLNGIEDSGRWSLARPTPSAGRFSHLPPGEAHAAQARSARRASEGSVPPNVSAQPAPHPSAARSARRATSPQRGEGRQQAEAAVDHIAHVLLRRWGVVFWKLLEREAPWLPPWRELRRVYQRLEARGEIRGGRFVEGMVGEQFALPEAVEVLRRVRRREVHGVIVSVSGADPLNLIGGVLAGARVPSLASSRIVYRDGVPVATRVAGDVTLLQQLASNDERVVRALFSSPFKGEAGRGMGSIGAARH
ncbi:MAG: Lhr family helicase, partial [Rhodanobacteraceae bacterium]